MLNNPLYKQALKQLSFLLVSIVLTRFSQGAWLGVMTVMGLAFALSGKAMMECKR